MRLRSPAGLVMLVALVALAIAGLCGLFGTSAESRAVTDCRNLARDVLAEYQEASSTDIIQKQPDGPGWFVKGKHVDNADRTIRYWECSTKTGEAVITWWSEAA